MTDEDLFAAALDAPDRAAALATSPDPEQRRRVERLLAAHDKASGFLNRPAVAGETRSFTGAVASEDDADDALGFLSPPTRGGSLGRLGHYEVLEILGRGGFGIVFRAFDDTLQRVVAVKILSPAMSTTSPARKRFLREARSSAAIRHENVVQVHAVEEQPLPHLVMEFVPGESLQQRLDRSGPLDFAEALRIGRQIAEGLAAAHATGVIHRDIKPANILLDRGPVGRAVITDFGLARAADDASLTRSGTVAGTPLYMAPEQARGETLDHRADLFSLGSVLYALLTGRPPFRAESTLAVLKRVADDDARPIREIIPETPEWFCRVVEKLHAKDPAERFQSAREVADLLADCEAQLAAHKEIRDFSRIPGGGKPVDHRIWPLVSVFALLLMGLVGLVLVLSGEAGRPEGWWAYLLVAGVGLQLLAAFLRPVFLAPSRPSPKGVPARWGRVRRWAVAGAVVFAGLCAWAGPWAVRYANGVGKVEFEPAPGLTSVILHKDGAAVTDWIGMDQVKSLDLPPGKYRIEPAFGHGRTVQSWEIHTHEPLSFRFNLIGVRAPEFEIARGERVSIKVVMRDDPATAPTGTGTLVVVPESPAHVLVERLGSTTGKMHDSVAGGELTYPTERPGQYRVHATRDGAVVYSQTVRVVGGERTVVRIPAAWTQLFNGRDLTGWKTLPGAGNSWAVKDGLLGGTGPEGNLFSERTYRDFHLRAEARVSGGDDSGIFFRAPFEPLAGSHPYEAQIIEPNDGAFNTGSLWGFDECAVRAAPAKSGEWFTLEVIARGNHLVLKVDGKTTVDWTDPKKLFDAGHLALQHLNPAGRVEFRKVEIRELPAAPPGVPQGAADILAFIRGTWKRDGVLVEPKPPADTARTGGQLAFTPVAGGKVIRGLAVDEQGRPLSLILHAHDAATDRLHSWYFGRDGETNASRAGVYDPTNRTFVWMESLPDGTRADHHMTFADANTVKSRHYDTDAASKIVYESRVTYTRSAGTPATPVAALDPNRPPEMAVLDRLVGEWRTETTVTAGGPAKREAQRVTSAPILGGRFVESVITNEATQGSDYTIAWYDPAKKQYRQWFFHADGYSFELTGTWDEAAQALTWRSADGRMEGRWAFKPDGTREFTHQVKNGGKVVSEAIGTARRASAAPQPTVLRKFDPAKDKLAPLRGGKPVTAEDGAFRIENDTNTGNWLAHFDTLLDNVPKDGVIVFRAKVKVKANHKYTWGTLQLGDKSPADHKYEWPPHLFTFYGDVPEWIPKEVRYPASVFHQKNPPSIPVYVGLHADGVLWVKDAEVLHIPDGTRSDPKPPPGEAVRLWAFDPVKDKPGGERGVTVDGAAYRFETGGPDDRAFFFTLGSLVDDIPADGLLVFRANVRVTAATKTSWGRLALGTRDPADYGYDWPAHLARYDGDVPDWTPKEVRYPAAAFRKKTPPSVTVVAGLTNGVLWVKDAELWHVPEGAKLPAAKAAVPAVNPLRDKVASLQSTRDIVKLRYDAGVVNAGDLARIEADVAEARVALAESDGDSAAALAQLEEFVKHRRAERDFVAVRVREGIQRADDLNAADARLADARVRLVKAQPAPKSDAFDAKEAKARQERWAAMLGVEVEFAEKRTGMEFRVVPPGEFLMGSKPAEVQDAIDRAEDKKGAGWPFLVRAMKAEMPQHTVRISRPFAVGKKEVTVQQFRAFVEANKNYRTTVAAKGGHGWEDGKIVKGDKYTWDNVGYTQGDLAPVWNVSAEDAEEFCKWLSKETAQTFRLPTEAEWEWACRGGTTGRTFWGSTAPASGHAYAWGPAKSERKPQPGGRLKPNPFGLYDTCGNVWEWCSDWYGEEYYKESPVLDPTGPADAAGTRAGHRVQRGGSVTEMGVGFTSSTARPVTEQSVCGFRVVCELVPRAAAKP